MEPDSSQECQEWAVSEMFPRKRRRRTIIAAEQLLKLEDLYKHEQWPGREKKEELAHDIGMSTHFVNIWFQNKRSRMKKIAQEEEELNAIKGKLSESDCEEKVTYSNARIFKSQPSTFETGCGGKPTPGVSAQVRLIRPMPMGARLQPVVALGKVGTVVRPTQTTTLLSNVPVPTYHLRSCDKSFKVVTSQFVQSQAPKLKVTSGVVSTDTKARLRERVKRMRLQGQELETSGKSSENFSAPVQVGSILKETSQAQGPVNKRQTGPTRSPQLHPFGSTTLLRCLILMMALAESPGAVPPGTDEFDLAVRASLYGVKIGERRSFLTYDKDSGFRVEKPAKKSKKDKRKKKKKKRRLERRR